MSGSEKSSASKTELVHTVNLHEGIQISFLAPEQTQQLDTTSAAVRSQIKTPSEADSNIAYSPLNIHQIDELTEGFRCSLALGDDDQSSTQSQVPADDVGSSDDGESSNDAGPQGEEDEEGGGIVDVHTPTGRLFPNLDEFDECRSPAPTAPDGSIEEGYRWEPSVPEIVKHPISTTLPPYPAQSSETSLKVPNIYVEMESTSLIPPKFNGTGDVESWIYAFENYCFYKGESDQRRCALLPLLLTEQAFDWFQILEATKKIQYSTLRDALIERFGNSPLTRHKRARKLFERKQQANESVDTYVAQMLKLASSLGEDRQQLSLYAIVGGLKPHIATYVAQNRPNTIQELLEHGRVAELTTTERTDEPVLIKAVADLKTEIAKLGTTINQPAANVGETVIQRTVCPVNQRFDNMGQPQRRTSSDQPYNQGPRRHQQWSNGRPRQPPNGQGSTGLSECLRCGMFHSHPQSCRALGASCFFCGKLNHFRSKCRAAARSRMALNQGPVQGPDHLNQQ
jgi:Retrotransposon gag protein